MNKLFTINASKSLLLKSKPNTHLCPLFQVDLNQTTTTSNTRRYFNLLSNYSKTNHYHLQSDQLSYTQVRHAGHNKWGNIKHTKQAKDQIKAVLFSRFAYQIRKAVHKTGGPDPHLNKELADVIASARRSNVPTATIERSIKKGMEKQAQLTQVELIGPSGSLFIVEGECLNVNSFKNDIKKILKKSKNPGFGFAPPKRMDHCFESKGIVKVAKLDKDGKELDFEKAEEIAIEADAEEVQLNEDDDTLVFVCDSLYLDQVKRYIEEKTNLEVLYADSEMIAVTKMPVEEQVCKEIAEVIEKIQEHEEVIRVYDNIRQ